MDSMHGLTNHSWNPIHAWFTPLPMEIHPCTVYSTTHGIPSICGSLHCIWNGFHAWFTPPRMDWIPCMAYSTTHRMDFMCSLLHRLWSGFHVQFTPLHIEWIPCMVWQPHMESHLCMVYSTAYRMDSMCGLTNWTLLSISWQRAPDLLYPSTYVPYIPVLPSLGFWFVCWYTCLSHRGCTYFI